MIRWIKQRFGLHARRVTVRTHMPWYLRWTARAFVAVSIAFLLWVAYEGGALLRWNSDDTDSRLEQARGENAELARSNSALRSELSVLERQLQIERASHADLVRQVKELAHENARLREDNALLQAVSTADSKTNGVKVSSVRVEPNALPGEYSYRIVLLQTGSRTKQFQGRYQLVVNLLQNGERRGVTLPGPGEAAEAPYRLAFRVHQRIDGTFRVDPAAVVRSVELRVFEGRQTQPKVRQTVTLS